MKTVKLGDVCEFNPKKARAKQLLDDKALVSFAPMEILSIDQKYFTPSEEKTLKSVYPSYTYFEENDVIYAKITPCFENGKLSIAKNLKNGIGFGSSEFVPIRCSDEILPEYLYYFLLKPGFIKNGIPKMTGASGHRRVPNEYTANLEIELPSPEEQQRIVAQLDAAFEKIDRAIDLTKANIDKARKLYDSKLALIFDIKANWQMQSLEELGSITSSKRIYKSEYKTSGVPFFRTKEIKELAHNKSLSTELYIPRERYIELKEKFGVPMPGDILITAIGTIGEVYVVENTDEFYFKDGNVLWLKEFRSISPYFLKYSLQRFISELNSLSNGSAYNALPIQKLKKYTIPVPSRHNQENIVERLDSLVSHTRRLAIAYQNKIVYLNLLKQSMLTQAFSQGKVQ